MHVSYLNSTYDLRLLEQWKAETAEGISGIDAVGKRLGYRFVVENVEIHPVKEQQKWKTGEKDTEKTVSLQITLENKGFAELTEEAECWLEVELDGKTEKRIRIGTDPGTWNSGEKTVLQETIKLPAVPEQQKLFLALYRRRDKRPIRFANRAAEHGRVFLGTMEIC